ncbi:MAG: GNAT family N-acetyltransferase [Saprospiraceae bacterium]
MMTNGLLLDLEKKDLDILNEFQPIDWPDITVAFSFYYNSWYCQPMKLVLNHEIIGIGNIILLHDTAWLSQIIIKESFRNQGWGKYITEGLINFCRQKVKSISLLATPLGYPVYEKLGFKTQGIYHFYKGNSFNEPISNTEIKEYDTMCHCDILDMDKEVSGEIRARILQDHWASSKVILNQNKVIAYYLPALGEGMIISKDPGSGLELIKLHLNTRDKIVFPIENEIAADFLLSHGFNQYRQAHRMVIGQPIEYKPTWIYSRIGGNLG